MVGCARSFLVVLFILCNHFVTQIPGTKLLVSAHQHSAWFGQVRNGPAGS